MEKIYLKTYVKDRQTIVTVCDSDLVGKTLREGKLKLEVSRKFYEGQLVTMKQVIEALSKADAGNLVGENSVGAAVDNNLVDPAAVIYIAGVPHVQVVKL